jgi:hypothetical protein
MKKLYRMLMLLSVLGVLSMIAPAQQTYTTRHSKFSVALPSGWKMGSQGAYETYFDRTGSDVASCVSALDADVPLSSPRVITHIDLSNFKVTSDSTGTTDGYPARFINGTARSEGEDLVVRTTSIKPGANAEIIQLTVWGPPKQMKNFSGEVDALMSSFKAVQ